MVLAVRVIEQIGSYAGLAAIPGLAVLSALYFSQARDVRRLREWAGRAPERAAEQAAGGRPAVQQVQQPAVAAQSPAAATPAAATPGAAAAKPAVAAAAGATATATPATATPATATPEDTATPDTATPDEAKPDEAKPEEDGAKEEQAAASTPAAKPATPAGAAAASGGGNSTGTVARPGPPAIAGVRPTRTIPRIPSGSQTSVLSPASSNGNGGDPWYRRLPAARYIALIVVGVIVLGGAAVFGISRLAEDDTGGGSATPAADQRDENRGRETPNDDGDTADAAIDPADVTVTVVNGTTVAGLARDTAAKLSADGFQIGNKVTGTGSLAAAESVVQYKPGADDEAKLVAEKLNINQREPADADAIAQAGPATVIVVLGADQAPGG